MAGVNELAIEGRRLLDADRRIEARQLLTHRMEENVTTMLRTAREMVRAFENERG